MRHEKRQGSISDCGKSEDVEIPLLGGPRYPSCHEPGQVFMSFH